MRDSGKDSFLAQSNSDINNNNFVPILIYLFTVKMFLSSKISRKQQPCHIDIS